MTQEHLLIQELHILFYGKEGCPVNEQGILPRIRRGEWDKERSLTVMKKLDEIKDCQSADVRSELFIKYWSVPFLMLNFLESRRGFMTKNEIVEVKDTAYTIFSSIEDIAAL